MDTIRWNDSWLLEHDIVDEQHKTLVRILNRIISREDSISRIINELIEYTAIHFSDEEELMVRSGFKGLVEHRKEHQAFTKSLLDMSFGIMAINGDDPAELEKLVEILEKFAAFWFDHHFLVVDREFIDWLHKKGGGK